MKRKFPNPRTLIIFTGGPGTGKSGTAQRFLDYLGDDEIVKSINAYRRRADVVAREALKAVEKLNGLIESTFDPDAPIVIRG